MIMHYKIICSKNLILEYYKGDITLEDILNFKKIISEDIKFDPDFNVLMDFRKSFLNISHTDLNQFFVFMKENKELYGIRNTAFLTANPNEVVITTLFMQENEKNETTINPNIFTTLKAATRWVSPIENYNFIKEELDLLKF